MTYWRVVVNTVVASAVFSSALANAAPVDDLLALLAPIKGLEARFTQNTYDAKGGLLQNNQGEVKAQAPAKFFWKTAEPFPQTVVTDGVKLWVYDPDLAQVQIRPFDKNYQQTPAMLFTGNAQVITQQFTVEQVAGRANSFRLLPKDRSQNLFEALEMRFDEGLPVSMQIEDSMRQKTEILFSDVQLNPNLPAKDFSFVAPAGTEVLNQ